MIRLNRGCQVSCEIRLQSKSKLFRRLYDDVQYLNQGIHLPYQEPGALHLGALRDHGGYLSLVDAMEIRSF